MYRIKNKIMALGLALIMCTSVLLAAFLPEKAFRIVCPPAAIMD